MLKESDVFKNKFEKIMPVIENQLKSQYIWAVEEIAFKTFFDINYDTDVIYEKIRYILKNRSLRIKIRKNKIINGKYTNIFEFYTINDIGDIRKERIEINKNVSAKINNEIKNRMKNIIKEEIITIENKSKNVINNMSTNIPLPYICICFGCKKKVILKYPELNCPECNFLILNTWD